MKTRLTIKHRKAVVDRLAASVRTPRLEALTTAEHALALRMSVARFGPSVFARCRELPEGWIGVHKVLYLSDPHTLPHYQSSVGSGRNSYYREMPSTYLMLAEAAPLPNNFEYGWDALTVGVALWGEVHDHFAAHVALHEQTTQLENEATGVLEGFATVEALCEGWPEGYAFLPQEMLLPAGGAPLPAVRVEDLNARVEALRRAA